MACSSRPQIADERHQSLEIAYWNYRDAALSTANKATADALLAKHHAVFFSLLSSLFFFLPPPPEMHALTPVAGRCRMGRGGDT